VDGGRPGPVGGVAGGLDQGDLDAEVLDLGGEAGGEALQAVLRGVVDRRGPGSENTPAIEDTWMMWPPPWPAGAAGGLGDPQRAEQVDLDLVAGLLLGDLLDHAEQAVAGVVDHDVEAAEVVDGLLHGGGDGRPVGDVDLQGRMASPYLTRSSNAPADRLRAATRSPRSRAASVHSRPKPLDAPVMNQVLRPVDVGPGRSGTSPVRRVTPETRGTAEAARRGPT
jgi:hypothetical protein